MHEVLRAYQRKSENSHVQGRPEKTLVVGSRQLQMSRFCCPCMVLTGRLTSSLTAVLEKSHHNLIRTSIRRTSYRRHTVQKRTALCSCFCLPDQSTSHVFAKKNSIVQPLVVARWSPNYNSNSTQNELRKSVFIAARKKRLDCCTISELTCSDCVLLSGKSDHSKVWPRQTCLKKYYHSGSVCFCKFCH